MNAIHYLHSANLFHRDIKLENIFIEKLNIKGKIFYKAYLVNFSNMININKLIEKKLPIVGTSFYMAPEVLT